MNNNKEFFVSLASNQKNHKNFTDQMPASKLAQVLSRGGYKSRKQRNRVILVVSRDSNFKCRIAPCIKRSLDI